MIRILHSVSNMDRAGIETMLMNYYRHMDRDKIQFDFLCNKTKPGAYDDEIKKLGGNIYHTPGLNPIKYFSYLRYMKKLFKEHPEYKIIHAHNGAFVVYPLFAAKLNKIPIRISHVHSGSFQNDLKKPLKIFCKQFISNCCNYKFACGLEAGKFYYGTKDVAEGKVTVINNAIDLDNFIFKEENRIKIRKKYDLAGKFIIGHVGRFNAQKNHDFLLKIFDKIAKIDDNAVLVLLGDGELISSIKEKVKEMKLTEKVFFIGNVDNVNEWYSAFDVFVMPSISEGLPVVGIEAQASDLPCVFSDSITHEIDILPETTYLKLDEDIDVWCNKILSYRNGRKRVNRNQELSKAGYDINFEAKKLAEIYEKMLKIDE